jgi:hypothetical protein
MDGKAVSLAETSMTEEHGFPDKLIINSVEINDIMEGFIKEVGNASNE